MAKTAYFVRKDQWYIVGFDYDPALVADLKKAIPGRCRKYKPATRHWWISQTYWAVFGYLMWTYGYLLEEATE